MSNESVYITMMHDNNDLHMMIFVSVYNDDVHVATMNKMV
jgi:hypothetical protein